MVYLQSLISTVPQLMNDFLSLTSTSVDCFIQGLLHMEVAAVIIMRKVFPTSMVLIGAVSDFIQPVIPMMAKTAILLNFWVWSGGLTTMLKQEASSFTGLVMSPMTISGSMGVLAEVRGVPPSLLTVFRRLLILLKVEAVSLSIMQAVVMQASQHCSILILSLCTR